MERIPALDGSLNGWIEELERLRLVPAARVVPGHGPASAAWPEAAAAETGYLNALRDEVRAGIAQGAFMEDLMNTAARGERLNWLLFESVHPRNVSRAFTELEWE
jgi:glyoxylase-like metal-dependent hydrolase (beta-lactamase superfamily II)